MNDRESRPLIYFFLFRFLQCFFFALTACFFWRLHFFFVIVATGCAGSAVGGDGCWQAGATVAGLEGTILSTVLPLVT